MTILNEGMPNSTKTRTRNARKKKAKGGGEVIHVAFGPGGGRIQHADAPAANGKRALPGRVNSITGAYGTWHSKVLPVFQLRLCDWLLILVY